MEVNALSNIQDDRVSDCQSVRSNYLPSSQSRKVSIGILIDSLVEERSGAAMEDQVAVTDSDRKNSTKKGLLKVPSPWITTRSLQRKAPTSDETALHGKETSNLPGRSGRMNRLSKGKDVATKHSVEFLTNQRPSSHSRDGKKRFGALTYKGKGGKDGNSHRAEEFTFPTPPEVHISDNEVIDGKTEVGRTETLKMKLWEILGTVSSPKSQRSNSQACDTGLKNLSQKQILDQKGDTVVKPGQNSDILEPDAESPGLPVKGPVTRSLSRMRASDKKQPETFNAGPSSSHRRKLHEKNISIEDGSFGKGDNVANGGSFICTRKKVQIRNIEPCKISSIEKNNASENQGATHRNETSLPSARRASLSNKTGNFCGNPLIHTSETSVRSEKTSSLRKMGHSRGCPPKNKRECLDQKNQNQEGDSRQSPGRDSHKSSGRNSHRPSGQDSQRSSERDPSKSLGRASRQSRMTHRTDVQHKFGAPAVPENMYQQEDFCNMSLKNFVDQNGFRCPTSKVSTHIESSSPSSTQKADQIEQDVCSPTVRGRSFTVGNIWGFENLQTSKMDYSSIAQTQSPGFGVELLDSPASKISLMNGKTYVEDGLSESSSDDRDSQSLEEGSPITECCREADTSPLTATAETPGFMLYPKRLRNNEGNKVSNFSPTAPSPKGVGETDRILESSEENQEDELERVIMLFALALENFKNKMETATSKKSSEILMSVSEEIQLKLQNIETQIQTDMGKLTSTSKSKRKRLETRFQDQQEELKLIHDKFKQDIYQQLEDCKSTLEWLEVHQTELRGTVKKQKASHQKLVMQVEEAVEMQLNDAERRVTAVHKLARKKMLQLRHVISECLTEGILN